MSIYIRQQIGINIVNLAGKKESERNEKVNIIAKYFVHIICLIFIIL